MLQNRVDPFGEVVADSARGTLMGNRGGCSHDDRQQLTRARWTSARWIACRLEFRGRWRAVMQPHRYTELFFLDEATALAAGHRPCAQCRWADFNAFKLAWIEGNAEAGVRADDSIDAIDRWLHRERVGRDRRKRTYRAQLVDLPSGTMVTIDGAERQALLWWSGALYPWSFAGYREPIGPPAQADVTVLTPRSIVEALRAGYLPAIHPSLGVASGQARTEGPAVL
jgi:hypothetical protein